MSNKDEKKVEEVVETQSVDMDLVKKLQRKIKIDKVGHANISAKALEDLLPEDISVEQFIAVDKFKSTFVEAATYAMVNKAKTFFENNEDEDIKVATLNIKLSDFSEVDVRIPTTKAGRLRVTTSATQFFPNFDEILAHTKGIVVKKKEVEESDD